MYTADVDSLESPDAMPSCKMRRLDDYVNKTNTIWCIQRVRCQLICTAWRCQQNTHQNKELYTFRTGSSDSAMCFYIYLKKILYLYFYFKYTLSYVDIYVIHTYILIRESIQIRKCVQSRCFVYDSKKTPGWLACSVM